MQQSTIQQMQYLQTQGHQFQRIEYSQQIRNLIPQQLDSQLDTLKTTPAYQPNHQPAHIRHTNFVIKNWHHRTIFFHHLNNQHDKKVINLAIQQLYQQNQ